MITLKFYTTVERQPQHDQEIVVIMDRGNFGFECFEPRLQVVEYFWREYDQDGQPTGADIGFDTETESHHQLGEIVKEYGGHYQLCWSAQGTPAEAIAYWTPADEFWSAFDPK